MIDLNDVASAAANNPGLLEDQRRLIELEVGA